MLYALDAKTGEFKWRWDPEIPRQNFTTNEKGVRVRTGPSVCCGPVNRGVALYEGKIYASLLDGTLAALDADTGEMIWRVDTTNPEDDYSITGAVRVVKGKVIVGVSGAEFGVRGYVSAYDADTGELAWRFYTVPGDPSLPFENEQMAEAAKTWTGPWWKYGGGGTVWDGMAYDPDADLLYIGTGNGSPWNRDLRSPGGGDNLFLSSILALRPDTGEYVWHYQVVPGESWDYTATQPLMLADLTIDGRERKVIMQAPKNGFFYVLDRITGELISADNYAEVTWATGIDRKTGRPMETPEARYGTDGVWLQPGPGGRAQLAGDELESGDGPGLYPGTANARLLRAAEELPVSGRPLQYGPHRDSRRGAAAASDQVIDDAARRISSRVGSGHAIGTLACHQ